MNELKYVVEITDATGYRYYIGNYGTYQFQGEKYAVVVENTNQAKKYKTRNIAMASYAKLFRSCCNVVGNVKIIEMNENGDWHYVE